MQSDTEYKFLNEFNDLKEKLLEDFESNIAFLSEGYSNNRMGYPAHISIQYIPRDFEIHIEMESGNLSARITQGKWWNSLHSFLIDEGSFIKSMFKITEDVESKVIIEKFVRLLKKLVQYEDLYFYSSEGNKMYKKQGDKITKIDKKKFYKDSLKHFNS